MIERRRRTHPDNELLSISFGSATLGYHIDCPSSDHDTPVIKKSKMKNTQVPECVECHTTKTPMWRGGPAGPRSLCNACGIKYRKRNRGLLGSDNRVSKKPSSSSEESGGGKQRWKLREEEEAAFLLMALSCGSVSA